MNLQEQLAIQAMYDAGIEREKKANVDKPKPTLGPVASAISERVIVIDDPLHEAPRRRGRKPKAAE